ncbi:nitroreductase family protein [Pseudoxanthomonas suwonensis]|uniref:nitroreductase family protein n=1 Tax=Pseudoxanthomonas suwonensis TaxID=314722 RepID=UPI0004641814|nr:nitroreductase family protein [Pseudoxanthomonas suwonensis]
MFSKAAKVLKFLSEYSQDLWLTLRHNGYSPLVERRRRQFYKLIIETHTIEKGLSLPRRRALFGRDKVRFVMSTLESYDPSFSPLPAQMALGALDAYLRFHREQDIEDPLLDEVEAVLERWRDHQVEFRGGIKPFKLDAVNPTSPIAWLQSRSSLRMFDGVPVSPDTVREVVAAAQSAPSQCNRQSTHIHLYQDRETIDSLLALQGGSRGFSEHVGNLFVVTSEIAAWGGAGQRNQTYVDGALFSMCVLLSCHSIGLGACPLNLAVTNAVERKIKEAGGIPTGERLIMMIAFGNMISEPLRVAASPRRALDEILHWHRCTAS